MSLEATSLGAIDIRTGPCADIIVPEAREYVSRCGAPRISKCWISQRPKAAVKNSDWTNKAARRTSDRSIKTPNKGPRNMVGRKYTNAINPTKPAEPVMSQASQPTMMRSIHIAFKAKRLPARYRRKFRELRADRFTCLSIHVQ